jgi:arsenate reductase
MKAILYGIPNCDTVKKARQWLETNGVDYTFHDFKKEGVDKQTLAAWCSELGHETVLNQRGTTWRKLDEADRQGIDRQKAIALMRQHTSLIKRPVLEYGSALLCGFRPDEWETLL